MLPSFVNVCDERTQLNVLKPNWKVGNPQKFLETRWRPLQRLRPIGIHRYYNVLRQIEILVYNDENQHDCFVFVYI